MTRGICWVTWGDSQPEHLWQSVKSAKFFGLSTCLITAAPIENGEMFDHVVPYTPDHFDARGRHGLNKLNLSHINKQDQPGLAVVIYELGFNPYVLPHTWNFRPDFGHVSGFCPIYIWHSQKPVPHGVGDLPGFWKFDQ